MPTVSISGFKYNDLDRNAYRANTLIKGSDPDVVVVLDISGSTASPFYGQVPVGDLNGDGVPNTILDAEISAAGSLHASLLAQGFGGSQLGLVAFESGSQTVFSGKAGDQDGAGGYSFYNAALSLQDAGGTNYTAGLQSALDILTSWGSKQGNVIFMSDGQPSQNGVSVAQQLKAAGHNVQAFGVGNGATKAPLDAVDSDGSSFIFQTPDELKSVLSGQLSGGVLSAVQYTEPGLSGVTIYVDLNNNAIFDGGEPSAVTDSAGNYTITAQLADGTYSLREVVPTGYQQTEIPGQLIVSGSSTSFTGINFGNALAPTSVPVPINEVCDYLKFTPDAAFPRPTNVALEKFYDYVDRYPLTLKQAFIADYKAGKASSQHLWGQQHWLTAGKDQGRVLEVVTGTEDVNDYGAYVENYGTTLLDIYRSSPDSNPSSPTYKSLFNWGKEHYNTVGKQAGRQINGGADYGAIVLKNFDLYTKWQDARIVDPDLSAFAFGYRNQNTIKASQGVQVGRDTQEKLTGQYVYTLGGNDVLTGTVNDDLLVGGFGDDLICNGNGGTDLVYGGPGQDVFQIRSGGTLDIRDFRKGNDFIKLASGLTEGDIKLQFDGLNNATLFKKGSETLAAVYGTSPLDFSFAAESDGIKNVFIA